MGTRSRKLEVLKPHKCDTLWEMTSMLPERLILERPVFDGISLCTSLDDSERGLHVCRNISHIEVGVLS